MADDIVTWRLHKKGVMLLAGGCLLVSILTFVAGYILGHRTARIATVPPAAAAKKAAPKPAAKAAPAKPAEPPQNLALRVALFTSEEDAKALVAHLAAAKLEATVIPMPTSSGLTIYSVEAGHYTNRGDALKAAHTLEENHGLNATVVPAGHATLAQ